MENFKPIVNDPPVSFFSKVKFSFRLIFDFQTYTLYKHLRQFIPEKKGTLLDIGCGNSPYEHLLNDDCTYIGLDIDNQSDFDYFNKKILFFNGSDIPLEDQSVDSFICTEVLEHVSKPDKLISEMRRVLKSGGKGLISIPWSARYHYIPHDYYRYTPSALKMLLKDFRKIRIDPRGTDITVICSKCIVSVAGALSNCHGWYLLLLPLILIVGIPVVVLSVVVGHLSIMCNLGSKNDPLGYTIYVNS